MGLNVKNVMDNLIKSYGTPQEGGRKSQTSLAQCRRYPSTHLKESGPCSSINTGGSDMVHIGGRQGRCRTGEAFPGVSSNC